MGAQGKKAAIAVGFEEKVGLVAVLAMHQGEGAELDGRINAALRGLEYAG